MNCIATEATIGTGMATTTSAEAVVIPVTTAIDFGGRSGVAPRTNRSALTWAAPQNHLENSPL
jgi:hypothetical protein